MKQYLLLISCIFIFGCEPTIRSTVAKASDKKENIEQFITTMQKHLDAVSNKDLASLKETMAPNGQMSLIVPASERIDSVKGFMDYHTEWFKETNWTFETRIIDTEISEDLGTAIVEIIYREPERNGVPYFNRMHVSYVLKKFNGIWSIIQDHASSIEKSTDKK